MSQNLLTASAIADLIKQGLAGDKIIKVRVLDHPANPMRRPYPLIEVLNIQPDGREADPRVTSIVQKFTVALYVRVRGAGTDEVAFQKSVEDSVIKKLDASTLGGSTLFVENKIWTRPEAIIERPILHYQSRLAVLVTQIISTTGAGAVGAEMSLTVPGLTDMPLLSKPIEREQEVVEDIYDDTRTRQRVAPIAETHSFFGEVEHTQARIDQLRTLKIARSKIACIVKRKDGVESENFNGFLVAVDHGAAYENIETIVVQIERVP